MGHQDEPAVAVKWSDGSRRLRFAQWLPWKLFQEQMDPQRANHGWFIGRYARECLHILPKVPGSIIWPFRPVSVLEWHQVRLFSLSFVLFAHVSQLRGKSRWTNRYGSRAFTAAIDRKCPAGEIVVTVSSRPITRRSISGPISSRPFSSSGGPSNWPANGATILTLNPSSST